MAGFKVRSHSHLADPRAPAPNSQGKAGRCRAPVHSAALPGIWPRPGAARPRTGVGAETGLRGAGLGGGRGGAGYRRGGGVRAGVRAEPGTGAGGAGAEVQDPVGAHSGT